MYGEERPMTDDLDRPADTRLMGIVHNALRRDLDRARAAICAPTSAGSPPSPRPNPPGPASWQARTR
jgi:hypothetical protein